MVLSYKDALNELYSERLTAASNSQAVAEIDEQIALLQLLAKKETRQEWLERFMLAIAATKLRLAYQGHRDYFDELFPAQFADEEKENTPLDNLQKNL